MSNSWAEVTQAQKEKRCELVLSGPFYDKLILKGGLDPGIFQIKHLNFLEISKTSLKDLPSDVGELVNLTRMVVCSNALIALPPEIGKLKKLKYLDVSHNKIAELPSQLCELTDLQSLNVSTNKLSSLPTLNEKSNLVTLNISYNNFSVFPVNICDAKLKHFTDLLANNNDISAIPPEIEHLSSLKVLDLGENALVTLPGELGSCTKIKELNLKGNPLKDNRLNKLLQQCHVKQVMEYIRQHYPKVNAENNNKQAKSKKKTKQNKKVEIEEEGYADVLDELKVLHVSDETLKVITTPKVVDVRPYIVCCKVLNVNLSDGSLLKKFITLQTKLHDSICEKRTAGTIATHDIGKIQGDLIYDAKPPQEIKITPLNRKKELTAAELYTQLNDEADAIRKEKKKNTYSGIHKYLYLLKDKQLYPCLTDSSGTVISFPPITNSDATKISSDTKSMLLEVTGNNLNTCKKVMDRLLEEILKLGIGNSLKDVEGDMDERQQNILSVQQIKIVDEEGQLKVVYPSRTDIQIENISVTRT
ncbi:leucine-rich repeat-containing protein 47-like [Stegodyphus dumicola]|uniref:leucine-rich repeat-containing protein 47-like n=1 Tax=Stegodyphus dumicola TaxID=202533 RepID=UPI0015B0D8F3|nr:leucine-rich repeat-containing protein 47-like [Stegodyphus dumicola]